MNVVTSRLRVRRFAEADLQDFLAYQGLPGVRRFMRGEAMGREEAVRYLAGQAALAEDARGKWHGFAVEHLAQGRVIGDVGVFLQVDPPDEGDVGFQFHPDCHGKGYAAEATQVLLRHLFTELDLRRVTASCDEENVASFRLMERLGMRRVAQAEHESGHVYSLDREEWLVRQSLRLEA